MGFWMGMTMLNEYFKQISTKLKSPFSEVLPLNPAFIGWIRPKFDCGPFLEKLSHFFTHYFDAKCQLLAVFQ